MLRSLGRSLSDTITLGILSWGSCHGARSTKRGYAAGRMIAQMILSIFRGTIEGSPGWQHGRTYATPATNGPAATDRYRRPLAWVYLYAAQVGNVPEEELTLSGRTRPGFADEAGPLRSSDPAGTSCVV